MQKRILSFILIMTLLININVMGVSAASTEAPNPELSGILEEPGTGVEYILYNPDITTSTNGKPIIFVFHGIESSESELDAGGGLAAYQLISRNVIKPNALIVFVRKDYGNWADNSEHSLKSQIYATFIHNVLASTGADTSRVYYYGFSMGAWDGPAIIKACGEGTFKAAVFNDGNPFSYITNDDLEEYVLEHDNNINHNRNEVIQNVGVTPIEIDTQSYGIEAENVTIKSANISNEYKIAWISDLHIMLSDNVFNEAWYTSRGFLNPAHRISMFRDINQRDSYQTLPVLINCLNNNDFDYVVFGGDIIDNYSEKNYNYLKSCLQSLQKPYMILSADHDYLSEMVMIQGNEAILPVNGIDGLNQNVKTVNIGKNGDSLVLVGQSNSNNPISSIDADTIINTINSSSNALFFTHVGLEPVKVLADNVANVSVSVMEEWSKTYHANQVYYWSKNAHSTHYKPAGTQLSFMNRLYNSTSLKGVFAGHIHASSHLSAMGQNELVFSNTAIEHIFDAAYKSKIGVITVLPAGNNNDNINDIPVENNPEGEGTHNWLGLQGIYIIEGMENHYDINAGKNTEKGRNAIFLSSFSGNLRVEDYSGKTQDWINGFSVAVKNGDAAVPPWNCMEVGDAYNWLLRQ